MRVAIIGMGFVGLSLAVVFASKGIKVYGIERNTQKLRLLREGKSPFFEPNLNEYFSLSLKRDKLEFFPSIENVFDQVDIIFVTVGTPNKNGSIYLGYMKSVAVSLGKLLKSSSKLPLIVIKSTVTPGTTHNFIIPLMEKYSNKKLGENFYLATNPEFLREGSAIHDQLNPHLMIIGSSDDKSKQIITEFYQRIFSRKIPKIYVNFATSELIKYVNNAFLATKITFINTISNLCQKIPGANVDVIANAIGMDPRIGKEFLKAGPGYGGSCFPKDMDALLAVFNENKVKPTLLESVKEVNIHQIDQIMLILKQKMNTLKGKSISILGLSFKENSDDVRESTSIKLIQKLLKEQSKVKVHDPMAISNTKSIFKNKISFFEDERDCLKQSDCVIIMTPWPQYKKLNRKDIQKMRHPLVIDTRRILSHLDLKEDYVAFGISEIQN